MWLVLANSFVKRKWAKFKILTNLSLTIDKKQPFCIPTTIFLYVYRQNNQDLHDFTTNVNITFHPHWVTIYQKSNFSHFLILSVWTLDFYYGFIILSLSISFYLCNVIENKKTYKIDDDTNICQFKSWIRCAIVINSIKVYSFVFHFWL